MNLRAHLSLTGVATLTLCFGAGCPQMLDDEFSLPEAVGGSAGDGAGDGAAGVGATGGTSAIDANGGTEGETCVSSRYWSCGREWSAGGSAPDSGSNIFDDFAPPCNGSLGPNGDCYRADSTETTWSEARAGCQALGPGWDLATIRNSAENDFVLALSGFEAWIGATDLTNEGIWLWVRNDSLFFDVDSAVAGTPFTNWSSGEPNDSEGGSDCLRILTTGEWADWLCDSPKGHICQQSIVSPAP